MNLIRTTLAACAAILIGSATLPAAQAAGGGTKPPGYEWSFDGPFGTFDRAQLQRGYKVYREVCSACHAMGLVRFRNLSQKGGPEFTEAQVRALAADFKIMDGPNDQGEMFERPGRPSDAFPKPFPNEQAARAANGGAYPPDMSVLAKARNYERGFPLFLFDILTQYQEGGPDYIKALMTGYEDPPAGTTLQPGQNWNKYMPGNIIAMPNVLNDGQIEYPKGVDGKPSAPETAKQYAADVTAFLMWAAEPHMEQRKRIGFQVIVFLILFAGLLYFTKKRIWSRLPEHAPGTH
ncbi:MAG: cytochrome c1 [Hyphomicrobiales bacterium]|nr:cytochrome c1 [Hyphomicrobiales bacterium]